MSGITRYGHGKRHTVVHEHKNLRLDSIAIASNGTDLIFVPCDDDGTQVNTHTIYVHLDEAATTEMFRRVIVGQKQAHCVAFVEGATARLVADD